MPIDPNIALSFKPSVALEDPLQQYGRMQQIQANAMAMRQARNENALAARKLQGETAYGKAVQSYYMPQPTDTAGATDTPPATNASGAPAALGAPTPNAGGAPSAFSAATRNPEVVVRSLVASGRPDLIPDALKRINEDREQTAKAQDAMSKAITSRLELRGRLLANIDTVQGLLDWSDGNHKDDLVGPWLASIGDFGPKSREAILALGNDPAKIERFKQEAALGVQEFIKQNKPTTWQVTTNTAQGPRTTTMSMPGLGGPATEVTGSAVQGLYKPEVTTTTSGEVYLVDPGTGTFREPTLTSGVPGARAPAPAGAPAVAGAPAAGVPSIVANNNPGALEYRPWMRKYGGEPAKDGRFAAFPTPQQGAAAQEALLRLDYIGKGVNTIDKIVDKYLGTGAENTPEQRANYKATLVQQLGIPANAQLQPGVVPKLAAAMRGFETGMGANAPGTPSAAPSAPAAPQAPSAAGLTPAQLEKRRSAIGVAQIMGWNPETGEDRLRDLILASPSGGVDTAKNWLIGQVQKEGTPASNAAAALDSAGKSLVLAMAPGGKLSAGFSNEDRKTVEGQIGDINNTLKPVGDRLAAYEELQRFIAPRLGIKYKPPKSRGGKQGGGRSNDPLGIR